MSAGRGGVFVTGTDTGVGKTLVACGLLRALRARGIGAGAMKPVETGVGPAGPADARALRAAAGADDPLEDVCPQRFALPAAPTVAARSEGAEVSLDAIDAAWRRLCARHAFMVVEGAGGLLVPVTQTVTMADLAARLALPLVIVTRASLGTLNHTRLTLEAARARGLPVAGLVISHGDGPLLPAHAANLAALRADPGAPLLGEIPPLAAGEPVPPGALEVAPLLASCRASSRHGGGLAPPSRSRRNR